MEGLKALVIGSTGGIGRELVRELLQSKNWSEVHVIVRRELDSWKNLEQEQKDKLKIIKVETLDILENTQTFNNFQGINSVFCCLGAEQKHGKENFIKVDQQYPVFAADIAKLNNIPQYHIVTSQMSDQKSCFLYLRVKGQVENMIQQKSFNFFGVYRPGLLLNRQEPRLIEKICSVIPFIKKADVNMIAKTMRLQAEKNSSIQQNNKTEIFENDQIVKLAKESSK